MQRAVTVEVPIHYGRRSSTRGNTYSSIVFDMESKLGQARIVPFSNDIESFADLAREATEIWTAELNGDNQRNEISASWGCVALLASPEANRSGRLPADLVDQWSARVAEERVHYDGRECVNAFGQLLIDWPKISNGKELGVDLLLATANFPDGKRPTEKQIAESYWHDDLSNVDYFIKNRKHDIQTAYDHQILRELATLLK
jgi:hypothetical protein